MPIRSRLSACIRLLGHWLFDLGWAFVMAMGLLAVVRIWMEWMVRW